MSISIWKLKNHITVVAQPKKHTLVVQAGFLINVGTRDENANLNGIAHFFEHMVFKGTQRRKPWHILNTIDSVGGEINAYTTREKTCFHTVSAKQHLNRSLDLLTDIVFHSNFPEQEIEKEKSVVFDEIDMYADMPEEAIFDELESLMFPNHSLGLPILGSKETVNKFQRNDLIDFRSQFYTGNQIVLSVAGNVSFKILEKFCQNHLENLEFPSTPWQRNTPKPQPTFTVHREKPIQQAHLMLAGYCPSYYHKDNIAFGFLMQYLGGESMNTRLNLNIREKYGISYNISTFHTPYQDTGIWGIYAGFEPNQYPKLKKLIFKELDLLMSKKLSEQKLYRLKKQFIGRMTLSSESNFNRMQSNAKDLLDYHELRDIDYMIQEVQSITPADIQRIAIQTFQKNLISELLYLPTKSRK